MSSSLKNVSTKVFLALLTGSYVILFSYLKIAKYNNLDITCLDLWEACYLGWSFATAPFDFIHDNPQDLIFFLLEPAHLVSIGVYNLFQHPWILLIFQSSIMASGIPLVFLISKRQLGGTFLPLSFSIAYALNPLVNMTTLAGIRPISYAIPFLLLEYLFYLQDNRRMYLVTMCLANLGKINIIGINLLFGVYLYLLGNKKNWGRSTIVICSLWLGLLIAGTAVLSSVVDWTMPSYILHLNNYGENLYEIIQNLAADPLLILRNCLIPENLKLMYFILPLACLSLIAPSLLLPNLLELLFILVSMSSIMTTAWYQNMAARLGDSIFFHPNLFILTPFLFITAISGMTKARTFFSKYLQGRIPGLDCILALALILAAAWSHYSLPFHYAGPLPFSRWFEHSYYSQSDHAKIGLDILEQIPPDVPLVTQYNIFHGTAAHRKYFHCFSYFIPPFSSREQFILLDLEAPLYFLSQDQYAETIRKTLENADIILNHDGYMLLKYETNQREAY